MSKELTALVHLTIIMLSKQELKNCINLSIRMNKVVATMYSCFDLTECY